MDRKTTLAIAVLCTCSSLAKEMTDIEALTSEPKRCTYGYAHEMYGADCARLGLDHIPNLRSGIEILDFSDNKLQELNRDTLSSYTNIKFLYFSENKIFKIEDDALTSLTDLQILDLSKNVLFIYPASILQLPSLRRLYLGGNQLMQINLKNFAENKDIRAPLELLDISNCNIQVLPDWGILPHLELYNISSNPLTSMETKHFSVMCNLAKVDMTDSIKDISPCALKPAITWFQEKHVSFILEDYSKLNSKEFKICPESDENEALNITFQLQACKKKRLQFQMPSRRTSRRTWLTISGGLAGFLVGFILLLYAMHRHNVSKTKTAYLKTIDVKEAGGDKQAEAVLLNYAS